MCQINPTFFSAVSVYGSQRKGAALERLCEIQKLEEVVYPRTGSQRTGIILLLDWEWMSRQAAGIWIH